MSTDFVSKNQHCGPEYWKKRWTINDISFHKERIHPMLEKHIEKLTKNNNHIRILFPLCGKAVDMVWLASLGHEVVGIDLAPEPIEQFFEDHKIEHTIEYSTDLKLYQSLDGKIKLYLGDFFKLTTDIERPFKCVWDRGGLVALPSQIRAQYAKHMQSLLADKFRYLLDIYEYDQSLYPGPPHCVKLEEIKKLYGSKCKIQRIESVEHPVPFSPALIGDKKPYEHVYFLTNH